MGIIAKDHDGNILASMCSTKPYISDPFVAEVVAAWKVVKFRRELGFQNIMMEGDMPEIVHALQKEGCCWSMYGQLIDDARILLNGILILVCGSYKKERKRSGT